MNYIGEFRANWPNLLGACVGLAFGAAMHHYILNLFGPELIAEFGWSKAEFALIGSMGLAGLALAPLAGWFVDKVGSRIAATVGFTAIPLSYLAFTIMPGDIYIFYAIMLFHTAFAMLSTTIVFTRVVVERFDLARGLSLSILMSGAPIVGALAVPVIGAIIETEGWRAAYQAMALATALGGVVAVSLIGKTHAHAPEEADGSVTLAKLTRADYGAIFRRPVFWLIIAGMFFCNFPQVIVSSQLKLVLLESGAPSQLATYIISLYAVGVVVGRFASGIALDKISPQLVAIVALGLPAIGFLILASPATAPTLLGGAVLLVGLAQGAEGDIGAYLTSRKFDVRQYGFVYSLLIATMGAAAAIGSIVLSISLAQTDSFNIFLYVAAALTVVGAVSFFLTGRYGHDVTPVDADTPDAPPLATD